MVGELIMDGNTLAYGPVQAGDGTGTREMVAGLKALATVTAETLGILRTPSDGGCLGGIGHDTVRRLAGRVAPMVPHTDTPGYAQIPDDLPKSADRIP
jgi:hypothetical protein